MTDILPTFTCFDDAIELFGRLIRADRRPTLVHASLKGDDGRLHTHAWVEDDGEVLDVGLLNGMRVVMRYPQLGYYAARHVQRTWRYELRDILRANRKAGTYGPWVPELIALCSETPRIVGRLQLT